ncbi:hypothetical protein D3C81_1397510 [compost metagenome]
MVVVLEPFAATKSVCFRLARSRASVLFPLITASDVPVPSVRIEVAMRFSLSAILELRLMFAAVISPPPLASKNGKPPVVVPSIV